MFSLFLTASDRDGRCRQVAQWHRCLSLHAGIEQGAHDARVPGAHDRVPATALERQPEGHARTPVLSPGGGGPLLPQSPRRRHAFADGPRLDRQGAGVPGGDLQRTHQRREGAGSGQARRERTQVSQRKEGYPHARLWTGEHRQRTQLKNHTPIHSYT
ncbi:hypothetical protein TNIN_340211 [Trichonephila inaurata madagascariensis]|uniref:Uncharacterized protein n=1 Tax=Trichonephila inaurata madagascariensis TaxID=2747483 RepID=A0A8X7CQV0_9ARAC|nr:hypothetical protein TNIN_340211 [Trichonephila inaurata madagascariensis]